MSIAKKILSIILSIALVMGISAMSVYAVQPEPAAGVQATASQWWEGLPSWVQSILRWLCFGWIWMKPITSQIQPLDAETVASNLMRAVETRDIDLFEEQLCLNLKVNLLKEGTEELSDKIIELFDAIDDDLVDYTWRLEGDSFERDSNGRFVRQKVLVIDFTTSTGSYRLLGNFEYHNNFKPEEMGIRSIGLFTPPTSITPIAQIRATHGENGMHD